MTLSHTLFFNKLKFFFEKKNFFCIENLNIFERYYLLHVLFRYKRKMKLLQAIFVIIYNIRRGIKIKF